MLIQGQSLEPLLTPDMPEHFMTWVQEWQENLYRENADIGEAGFAGPALAEPLAA